MTNAVRHFCLVQELGLWAPDTTAHQVSPATGHPSRGMGFVRCPHEHMCHVLGRELQEDAAHHALMEQQEQFSAAKLAQLERLRARVLIDGPPLESC